MTDQISIDLDTLPAHQRHSPTSKAAAEAIKPRVGEKHRQILTYLKGKLVGATDEQMQDDLRMKQNTQRPRRRELQLWGLVADSGLTWSTASGRQAVVWRLATAKTPTHRGCSDAGEGTQ